MISGEITELDEEGNPSGNGIRKNVFLNLTQIPSENTRNQLTGLSKESRLRFVPAELFGTPADAVQFLGIDREKAEHPGTSMELEVKDIYHVDPAPLDQELFEKVYPGKEITTEEAFLEQVKQDAAGSFAGETDKIFYRQVSDKLIETTPLPLPDDFLKRWLLEQKENKMTPEDIEKQYDSFSGSTRWQLIENKLFIRYGISVKDEDIRKYIKDYFLRQIPMTEDDPERDKKYESLIDTVMENKEQVSRINDELYTNRLMELFRTQLQVEEKPITYQEFIKLASSLHGHDHEHDHDEEHEHDHKH
jgi:trigger factor